MIRLLAVVLAPLLAVGTPVASAAAAQTDGPAPGVVYGARMGSAEVRLTGLGETPSGEPLVLLDVELECEGFEPQGRLVGVVEDDGRFEVEGPATEPGTTDVITGEFDDIDGKVRSDGAVLEIDVEIEGVDNAGPTGRCEETQQWRLEPRRSPDAERVAGAAPTEAQDLATNGDALFTLMTDDGPGELARVDPATLSTTWTVDVPEDVSTFAASADAVWLFDNEALELIRIGALSGDVEATIPLESPEDARRLDFVFSTVAASPTAVWVAIDETETLYRVDAATNALTSVSVPGRIDALGAASVGVYASVATMPGGDARLARFDDNGLEVASAPIEDLPSVLVVDEPRVWARSTDRVAAYDVATLFLVGDSTLPRLATALLSDLLLAAAPGAWTPSTRGLQAFDELVEPAFAVPVVGAAATGLAAAEGSVFVIDTGYLIEIDPS